MVKKVIREVWQLRLREPKLWQVMGVRIFSIIKTIQDCGIFPELLNCFLVFFSLFTHFCVELVPLDKATFSGQDEVRTSNLLHLSWEFLHSGLVLQPSTESLSTSYHITFLSILIPTFQLSLFNVISYIVWENSVFKQASRC